MGNEELLLAMSEMMDKKIGPLENRMDSMEISLLDKMDIIENRLNDKIDCVGLNLNNKIDAVEQKLDAKIDAVEQKLDAKIDTVEQKLDAKIDAVDFKVHRINLKLENDIEPRLKQIEKCYTDTFRRYQYGVEKIEKLEADNEVIRSVVQKHHEVLKTQLA